MLRLPKRDLLATLAADPAASLALTGALARQVRDLSQYAGSAQHPLGVGPSVGMAASECVRQPARRFIAAFVDVDCRRIGPDT